MNALAFETHIEKVLAPTLEPSDIVIMDNLPAHKGDKVRELIEAKGAARVLPPPDSADLNPIEMVFAKLKGASGGRRAGSGAVTLLRSVPRGGRSARISGMPATDRSSGCLCWATPAWMGKAPP